jgi:hypothetical protein
LLNAGTNLGGPTSVSINSALTLTQLTNNPFLIRSSTRVRDFRLQTTAGKTYTNVEGFYVQDDFKVTKNVQFNMGLRWDYQQAIGSGNFSYVKLNNFKDNLQPRVGLIWDFTKTGRGKVFINYARFLETPLPLDVNVRAGSDTTQTDINLNVTRYSATAGSQIAASGNLGNLGSTHTPVDTVCYLDKFGNEPCVTVSNHLKPQTVNEATAGFEYEVVKDLAVGFRGIYRAQGSVIEDGSLTEADTYFLFNPGETFGGGQQTAETIACSGLAVDVNGNPVGCFGRARRYYRALEFTATKRFTHNWQFIGSYVYSSLIGNYEGLFRNDNGQSDPNITSLFDLVSLLKNFYGRLPNDRPHQLKFDGSYRTPWKLLIGASFRAQTGIPFNQLVPHPLYGNNEGFGLPRGTAIVPTVATTQAGFPNVVDSIGSNRTPFTTNLDLNAYYPISLGENKQLRFQVDWFNVFNTQRAIRLDETYQLTSGISGVPAFLNPTYGAGTIFQFPSSVRLGVKFQF